VVDLVKKFLSMIERLYELCNTRKCSLKGLKHSLMYFSDLMVRLNASGYTIKYITLHTIIHSLSTTSISYYVVINLKYQRLITNLISNEVQKN
jgi:hypothetical protein